MSRTLAWLVGWTIVAALFLAFGPWALVGCLLALVLALLTPAGRRGLRPRHPWWGALVAVVVVGLLVATVAWVPTGRLPIPPGAACWSPRRTSGSRRRRGRSRWTIPQHPFLAANGRNSMHDDGWATDAYRGPGPLGKDPRVDTSWFGLEECATLAFDADGRIVAMCGDLRGPLLRVLDPESMRPLATRRLPDRPDVEGKAAWENLCAGAYFYLDPDDRAVVATTDRRILQVETSDERGRPVLEVARTFDVSDVVPRGDCLVALMPDWSGRIWFATQDGRVGAVDPRTGRATVRDLGEEVANSLAVDATGVYVVTVRALYKVRADRAGKPVVAWRATYDHGSGLKPGQLSAGSGTTPTVLPGGRVAITDNADPRMNVVFLDTTTGRTICRAPVFGEGESASDNSLVSVGDGGVVVENNYGYGGPDSTMLGRTTSPGIARVDLDGDSCRVAWTSDEVAPTSVPKASLDNGLAYFYTKRPNRWGVAAWYLTALDVRTGTTVWSVRTGLGLFLNNHYAAITLAPDGSAYVATLGGMVRVRDR